MAPRNASKALLCALLSLLLVCALALPALAASDNVQEVLTLLERYQRYDIDPDWPPDVAANQNNLQTLLDAYLACSEAEKAAFTAQQNSDLLAYFRGLYQAQGKDPDEADALFGPGAAAQRPASQSASSSASSSSRSASSSGTSSSSPASSSSRASSSQSTAVSSASPPASGSLSGSAASETATLSSASDQSASASSDAGPPVAAGQNTDTSGALSAPLASVQPQIPQGNDLLSSPGLGPFLLVVIAALALILLIRFLAALRSINKQTRTSREAEMVARELYGDDYGPATLAALSAVDGPTPPDETAGLSPKERRRLLRVQRKEQKARIKAQKKAAASLEFEAVEGPEDSIPESPLHAPGLDAFRDPLTDRPQENPRSYEKFEDSDRDPFEQIAEMNQTAKERPASQSVPVQSHKAEKRSSRLAIKPGQRTGRPSRLPFSQGAATDLDAIDD